MHQLRQCFVVAENDDRVAAVEHDFRIGRPHERTIGPLDGHDDEPADAAFQVAYRLANRCRANRHFDFGQFQADLLKLIVEALRAGCFEQQVFGRRAGND